MLRSSVNSCIKIIFFYDIDIMKLRYIHHEKYRGTYGNI